jgi:hypothetical protein
VNERLAQALAECLEQIEAGAAPSSALAAQPDDLRCELAPLLDAALAVRALPAQPVQPAFRAEVARHLARLESARQPRPARRWRWPIAAADIRRRALATRLAAVAAVIVLVAACRGPTEAPPDRPPGRLRSTASRHSPPPGRSPA